jgi:site-specific recombinase XerD
MNAMTLDGSTAMVLVRPGPESHIAGDWPIVHLVLDRLNAPTSKTAYRRALRDFLAWFQRVPADRLDNATVQQYRAELVDAGLAPSSINQRLCAIRALAQEAADNDLLEPHIAAGIGKVKGVKSAGVRSGNWLTQPQAQALLDAPNTSTTKGVRDQAILGMLLGCGLRRSELVALEFHHVQQRDGRWAIVDIVGKGRRVRTVPMPAWTKVLINRWGVAADLSEGRVFRALRKGDRLAGSDGLSADAIADVVTTYAGPLRLGVAAHDCRTTFAKLALKGGARLEQIQLSLGHQSIQTIQRYLGVELDLQDAPCDHLGFRMPVGADAENACSPTTTPFDCFVGSSE